MTLKVSSNYQKDVPTKQVGDVKTDTDKHKETAAKDVVQKAVEHASQFNVWSANELYGSTAATTPKDVTNVSVAASSSTPVQAPKQVSTVERTDSNAATGHAQQAATGHSSQIQQTATVSALKGVTGQGNADQVAHNPKDINKNIYDLYQKHFDGEQIT